jgi:surface antigen
MARRGGEARTRAEIEPLGRRARRFARSKHRQLIAGLLALAIVVGVVASVGQGAMSPVPASAAGDDYPWKTSDPNLLNPGLRFNFRNCTDFVAWRLNVQQGRTSAPWAFTWSSLAFPAGNGNANGWRQGAINSGYSVDNKPAVGAVAWWDSSASSSEGHVALVSKVNADGSVAVEEYNQRFDHNYGTRPSVRADAYLHIADTGSEPPPPPVQKPQTISFGSLADRVYGEAPFSVSASATSGLPVSFTAGPGGICSISGTTVSVGEIGTCTVTAKQAGNADWLAAPDVSRSFKVNKAATTTNLSADPPGEVEFAQPVTFTANVSVDPPGSGTPTGTVDLTEGGRTLASGPVGSTTFTTDRLTPGDHVITATYSGDNHFEGSSASTTQKVTCATTITKSVPGTITVKGTVCIEPGVTIGGYVNIQKGGALAVNGATLRGGINSWRARAIRVCDTTSRASLQAAATDGFVIVGDAQGDCAGNAFRGGIEVLSTLGFVSVAHNEVGGTTDVSWSKHEGGTPEVAGNRITGFLKCFSNELAPNNVGQPNSVRANRQGQCKVPGF